MAEFTGFIVLKIGCQKSILICSCPQFEFTRTKPKRKSFMQKKLHVKFWTFGNKVADVCVDVPTWERWEHGVKNLPDFQTVYWKLASMLLSPLFGRTSAKVNVSWFFSNWKDIQNSCKNLLPWQPHRKTLDITLLTHRILHPRFGSGLFCSLPNQSIWMFT